MIRSNSPVILTIRICLPFLEVAFQPWFSSTAEKSAFHYRLYWEQAAKSIWLTCKIWRTWTRKKPRADRLCNIFTRFSSFSHASFDSAAMSLGKASQCWAAVITCTSKRQKLEKYKAKHVNLSLIYHWQSCWHWWLSLIRLRDVGRTEVWQEGGGLTEAWKFSFCRFLVFHITWRLTSLGRSNESTNVFGRKWPMIQRIPPSRNRHRRRLTKVTKPWASTCPSVLGVDK